MRHFNNYLGRADALALIESGEKNVSMTPTAYRQTPRGTIEMLEGVGVDITVQGSRGRPRKLSDSEVRRIMAIRGGEVSVYKIASITGIPKSTVHDYLRRHSGVTVGDGEIAHAQLEEARRVFHTILEKDLSEEINRLARRGFETGNLSEIEYLAGEINEIIRDAGQ